jgi:hypothetical protein
MSIRSKKPKIMSQRARLTRECEAKYPECNWRTGTTRPISNLLFWLDDPNWFAVEQAEVAERAKIVLR